MSPFEKLIFEFSNFTMRFKKNGNKRIQGDGGDKKSRVEQRKRKRKGRKEWRKVKNIKEKFILLFFFL